MVCSYGLLGNEWLRVLYDERRRWVPVFVKSCFWEGMSTTQRSESMHTFFDKYVSSKTTLKQFVEQYSNSLKDKCEKKNRADFDSFNSIIPWIRIVISKSNFTKHTLMKNSKVFQEEMRRKLYCYPSLHSVFGSISSYEVAEDVRFLDQRRDIKYIVCYNEVECDFSMHMSVV